MCLALSFHSLIFQWTGWPYGFYTIGSTICVSAESYAKVRGMTTKKAGEDFYFLHKVRHVTQIGFIQKTKVYPLARISERVPFGTGKSIGRLKNEKKEQDTFIFEGFEMLKKFHQAYSNRDMSEIPQEVVKFLRENTELEIKELFQFSPSHFYEKINGLWVFRFLNSLEKSPVTIETYKFLQKINRKIPHPYSTWDLLIEMRKLDDYG
jgi:hypothetical protein